MIPAALSRVLQVLAASGEWWWGVEWASRECEVCLSWLGTGLMEQGGLAPHLRARIAFEASGVRWQLGRHLFLRKKGDATEWHDGVVHRWSYEDPAEAAEALWSAGLAPDDDARRRWLCPQCEGRGASLRLDDPPRRPCEACGGFGTLPSPPDLRTLAAVASLGVPGWARAEELARVVRRDAQVVWRVRLPGLQFAPAPVAVGDGLRALGVHPVEIGERRVTLATEASTC